MRSLFSRTRSSLIGAVGLALTSVTAHATEAGANPYGLQALWSEGDFIAKSTLLILVAMSMASWYMIVTKFLAQTRASKQTQAVQDNFWSGGSIRQSADQLDPQSPYRFIAEKGLEGASKHDGLLGAIDFNTWVTMSIQRAMANVQSRMQDGLALLAPSVPLRRLSGYSARSGAFTTPW